MVEFCLRFREKPSLTSSVLLTHEELCDEPWDRLGIASLTLRLEGLCRCRRVAIGRGSAAARVALSSHLLPFPTRCLLIRTLYCTGTPGI